MDFNFDFGVDFFDWITASLTQGINFFRSKLLDDDFCEASRTYDGRHNFIERRTQVDGKIGNYYVCEYCGKSAGEVGKEAYSDYAATLPATGYNSDGYLLWQPTYSNLDVESSQLSYAFSNYSAFNYVSASDLPHSYVDDASQNRSVLITENAGMNGYNFEWHNINYYRCGVQLYFVAPMSGSYRAVPSIFTSYKALDSSGLVTVDYTYYGYDSSFTHYSSENFISVSLSVKPVAGNRYSFLSIEYYFPTFEIIPDAFISGDTYNVTTRPTSITGGNYGIIGDDGELEIITINDSIINEYNNTYYNPATGRGDTITNWSYDYSDRSYNVTLESGDTITVTYGDQNITIVEGGATYTVYYVIDGGCSTPGDSTPSDRPTNTNPPSNSDKPSGGDTHEHSWRQTSRKDPTCTLPGKVNFICDNCGQTRVDVLPANGHSWEETIFVPTQYDDNGNLIQWGYTIYECSVCGHQYKDVTGAGPPGSSSGIVDDGGLVGFFNSLNLYLSEHFIGAVDLILSAFRKIPEMFTGFTAFLSAMFPFLPDEVMMLLIFGIAAVVFIGIIKAIRR